MTRPDLLEILRQHCEQKGQAAVARELGYSPSAICAILSGAYQGNPDNILQRVREMYGQETVNCPVLGIIPLAKCAEKRRQPFAATNPERVRLYRACKTCGGKP